MQPSNTDSDRTQVSCAIKLTFRRTVNLDDDQAISQAKEDAINAAMVVSECLREQGYSVDLDLDYLVAYGA